jgi:CheY-like chemotaxis protein
VVETGKEALERAETGDYDIMLLDIELPDMRGTDVARELDKKEWPGGKPPLIALTAHAMASDREQIMEAGFSAYLTKPVDRDTLIEVVESLLESRAGSR